LENENTGKQDKKTGIYWIWKFFLFSCFQFSRFPSAVSSRASYVPSQSKKAALYVGRLLEKIFQLKSILTTFTNLLRLYLELHSYYFHLTQRFDYRCRHRFQVYMFQLWYWLVIWIPLSLGHLLLQLE